MNNLQHTKKRLTIVFTVLVFCLALLLEGVFFTFKYQNDLRRDVKQFHLSTENILSDISGRKKIFDVAGFRKPEQKPGAGFVSFIITDKDEEILFENIIESIDIDRIHFNKSSYKDREVLIKNKDIQRGQYRGKKITFLKNMSYSPEKYREDIVFFFLITLLFSLVFYYVGYKFVSTNLQPVEENLNDMQDFIHNAGHELKTPLSVIHGNLQIINASKKLDTKLTKESISEIERLGKLIEGLINLSDITSSSETEEFDASYEIESIVSDFSHESKKKKLKIDIVGDSFLVKSNKEYFYILFSNLVSNAIRYSKKGGEIKLILDKNSISVQDNGKGISKKDQIHIFDRFFQGNSARNGEGFGIGLSLVKKIADIYKWKISVESEKGKGSEFIVKF